MKIIIAIAFFIASVAAHPYAKTIDFSDERLVSGSIISAINDASQSIKDAGLDPLYIKKEVSSYALPVPVIFNYEAVVEELLSTGLSNIVIHRVSYNLITSRLNFDIELPLINLSFNTAASKATVFSNKMDVKASGKAAIDKIRIVGQVRVNVGIISGITVRSVTANFTFNEIKSDFNVVIQGIDYSDDINELVGTTVPGIIKAHYKEINELIEIVMKDVINDNL